MLVDTAGQQTNGAWVHTGRLTVTRRLASGARVTVTLPDDWATFAPTIPDGSITSAKIADGTIQAVDIADGAITSAKILNGTIDSVDLKDGSVTSAKILDRTIQAVDVAAGAITDNEIASNSATNLAGAYVNFPTFSTTAVTTWIATPLTTGSVAFGGGRVRISASGVVYHSVAGGGYLVGLLIDGTPVLQLVAGTAPAVSFSVPWSFTVYQTGLIGNHTVTVAVYNYTAGTLSLNGSVHHTLYAIEEKR